MSLDTISVTEAGSFHECKRYWYLYNHFRDTGLESKAPSIPSWIGRGVHKGMEGYFKSKRDLTEALSYYVTWRHDFFKKLQEDFGYGWDAIFKDLEAAYYLGWDMLENFAQFEESGNSKLNGEVVDVEKRFFMPILGPTRSPTNVTLTGKIDLILQADDGIVITDHKTHTPNSKPDFTSLDIDDQMTGYAYMYWRETNVVPSRIIYNVLMKATPKPPEVLLRGGLSKSKSQWTTWALYMNEIKKRGLRISDYTDILNYYALEGWDSYFIQEETFRNVEELLAYERRTYQRMREMREALENPKDLVYPSPSARNCTWCQYHEPCKATDDGGDPDVLYDTLFSPRSLEEYL